jgi:peptide deformylase
LLSVVDETGIIGDVHARRPDCFLPAGFTVSASPSGSDPSPTTADIGTLELVEYPHPALFRKAQPLLRIDEGVRDAIEQMFDIMYDAQGVGLAANQVALPYRMFVVNVTGNPNDGEELVFLNPTLSRPRGTAIQEEGCLSLPGLRADVRRPERVVVDAFSLDGQPIRLDLEGFLARVVQHEFDHLEGRLFTDRLPEAAALEVKRDLELLEDMFHGKQARGELPTSDVMQERLDRLEAERCR